MKLGGVIWPRDFMTVKIWVTVSNMKPVENIKYCLLEKNVQLRMAIIGSVQPWMVGCQVCPPFGHRRSQVNRATARGTIKMIAPPSPR